jgi:hypothetical protein
MEILFTKIFNQYGFGAAMALCLIYILFWIIRENQKDKRSSEKDKRNSENNFTEIINAGIESIKELTISIKDSNKKNEEAHSYQRREHEDIGKQLDKILDKT